MSGDIDSSLGEQGYQQDWDRDAPNILGLLSDKIEWAVPFYKLIEENKVHAVTMGGIDGYCFVAGLEMPVADYAALKTGGDVIIPPARWATSHEFRNNVAYGSYEDAFIVKNLGAPAIGDGRTVLDFFRCLPPRSFDAGLTRLQMESMAKTLKGAESFERSRAELTAEFTRTIGRPVDVSWGATDRIELAKSRKDESERGNEPVKHDKMAMCVFFEDASGLHLVSRSEYMMTKHEGFNLKDYQQYQESQSQVRLADIQTKLNALRLNTDTDPS